jgi:hypothetical protein
MRLADYWGALVRGWWLIVIFALGGLAVGLLLPTNKSAGRVVSYQSTSGLGSAPLATSGGSSQGSLLSGGVTPEQILYYANSDQVMEQAGKLSGLNEPVWQMRGQVSFLGPPSVSGNSGAPTSGTEGVVDIQVRASTPEAAVRLNQSFDQALSMAISQSAKDSLNTQKVQTELTLAEVEGEIASGALPPGLTAQALQVQVNALQQYLAQLVVTLPDAGVQIFRAPDPSTVTAIVSGNPPVNNRSVRAAGGLGVGAALGALAALALWMLDRRLKTSSRAELAFGYPVVAEIPADSTDSSEPYRMLWLSIFREPLPLPPGGESGRWYDDDSPVLEAGVGAHGNQSS